MIVDGVQVFPPCEGHTDEFFPKPGVRVADQAAKVTALYCSECLWRAECIDVANRHDIRVGIWGGLTYKQRRRRKATT